MQALFSMLIIAINANQLRYHQFLTSRGNWLNCSIQTSAATINTQTLKTAIKLARYVAKLSVPLLVEFLSVDTYNAQLSKCSAAAPVGVRSSIRIGKMLCYYYNSPVSETRLHLLSLSSFPEVRPCWSWGIYAQNFEIALEYRHIRYCPLQSFRDIK